MTPSGDTNELSPAELRALVVTLLGRVGDLERTVSARTVSAQRDEIARLKDLKGRPSIKPSGMEQAMSGKPRGLGGRSWCGKKPLPRVVVEDHVLTPDLPADAVPCARFKGYEDYIVQDLVIRPQAVRYRRERWLTADGRTVIASPPAEVRGHFGPELHRFLRPLYRLL